MSLNSKSYFFQFKNFENKSSKENFYEEFEFQLKTQKFSFISLIFLNNIIFVKKDYKFLQYFIFELKLGFLIKIYIGGLYNF